MINSFADAIIPKDGFIITKRKQDSKYLTDLSEGHKPEKQHEGLEEGPEVVVLVDGTVSVFLNGDVSKQL